MILSNDSGSRGGKRAPVALTLALCLGLSVSVQGAEPSQDPPAAAPSDRRGGEVWGKGYFPNVLLTTSKGREVRFFDDLIKDRVVVINFIYTTCADACPMETARLSEVAEILGERMGADIFFYSITIDPEYDTPERLEDYKQRFQAGPGWEFLTGAPEDIQLLREKLGLYVEEDGKSDTDHNLDLLMGNQRTGQWMKKSPFDNAYLLANQIGTSLSDFHSKVRGAKIKSYEDAPISLPALPRGQSLFRTRCEVCHNLGELAKRQVVGPDLMGVTERRDHNWLMRWIMEPDKMLAEGDPISLGLFAAYNKVPMPNLRISAEEAELLIDFIEVEGRRMAKVGRVEALAERHEEKVPECCQKDENVLIDGAEMAVDSGEEDSKRPSEAPGSASGGSRHGPRPWRIASLFMGGVFGLLALRRRD